MGIQMKVVYYGKAKDYSWKALQIRVLLTMTRPVEKLEVVDFCKN